MSLLADMDDAALLEQVRGGDTSAMAELWSRHYPATLAAARRISRQPRDAEELASDAFTAMLQALSHDAGPQTSVRAYLLTAVRNQATSRSRRSSSGDVLTDEIADFEDGDRDVIDPVAHHAELGLVREAFASLPHRWQTVLWRTAVDHDSNKAVAADLGMSPNALAALARRARLGFRTAYLQVHSSSGAVAAGCAPFVPRLVELLPGAKSTGGVAEVRAHVEACEKCAARLAELQEVDRDLRGLLLPALLALGPGIKWATATHLAGAGTAGALWSKLGLPATHVSKVVGVGTAAAVTVAGATAAYALTRPEAPTPPGHVASAPATRSAAGVVPPPPLATTRHSSATQRSAPATRRPATTQHRSPAATSTPSVTRTSTPTTGVTSPVSPSSLPRLDRTSTPPRTSTRPPQPTRTTAPTSTRVWTPKPTSTTAHPTTSTPPATQTSTTSPPPTRDPSSPTKTTDPTSTTSSSPTSTSTTPSQSPEPPWQWCYELPVPLRTTCLEWYEEHGDHWWHFGSSGQDLPPALEELRSQAAASR